VPLISMIKNAPDLDVVNGYVALLQRFLVMNGVLKPPAPGIDPVNGRFDSATVSAVKSFQDSSKIPVSGQVDGGTWAAIAGVSSPLTVVTSNSIPPFLPLQIIGDTDSVVTILQRLLVEFSGPQPGGQVFITPGIITKANVNGSFGAATKEAVLDFQKNVGLPAPDGEVGNNTWMKLLFPRIPVLPRDPNG
jgi:peptidoglycan hydrolase-like protein with peptidoglycan-binding domain